MVRYAPPIRLLSDSAAATQGASTKGDLGKDPSVYDREGAGGRGAIASTTAEAKKEAGIRKGTKTRVLVNWEGLPFSVAVSGECARESQVYGGGGRIPTGEAGEGAGADAVGGGVGGSGL